MYWFLRNCGELLYLTPYSGVNNFCSDSVNRGGGDGGEAKEPETMTQLITKKINHYFVHLDQYSYSLN